MATEKKLKIIHTEASPHWGGQEIRIFEEMKWFREQGHEMILVAPDNGTLYQRCKDEDFEVISLYFTKPRTLLNILRMIWVIWRKKPNVVATHSSTDSWAGLIAANMLGVKKRVRYRHISAPIKSNTINCWQYKSLANAIITTAECIKEQISDDLDIKSCKIHNIFTGISNKNPLPNRNEAREMICRLHGIDSNNLLIGIISVIRGWKGHRFVIKAFERFCANNPNTSLLIVGGGPGFESLKDYISENVAFADKIKLIGHKDNPTPYYRGIDICALASYKNEGVPQCGLHAMLAGTPFIGSNVGGIPEIIFNDKNGILFRPKCTEEIEKALEMLKKPSSIRNLIIENARNWVTQNATRDIQFMKCAELFLK